MSEKWFTHASPTMFNAGTKVPQMSSCFLLTMVRGPPVMGGYENNAHANAESFADGGWFDTGDTGAMDADGFLYITGRAKEVINRGG